MGAASKALWYIESHSREALSLPRIAAAVGLSPFHLARLFQLATGMPVMRYLRSRRLGEAAQQLAAGAGDIQQVALDAGYATHAAFTHAFTAHFGHPPEQVRREGTSGLHLQAAIRLEDTASPTTAAPQWMDGPALELAGLRMRYPRTALGGIPGLWQRLHHDWPAAAPVSFGVCCAAQGDDSLDYLATLPISRTRPVPAHWQRLYLPARRYLAVWHGGHIASIRATWLWLLDDYLPAQGLALEAAPDLERYDARFDDHTGEGGVELWLPVTLSVSRDRT